MKSRVLVAKPTMVFLAALYIELFIQGRGMKLGDMQSSLQRVVARGGRIGIIVKECEQVQSTPEPMCLVHLGKTAGSTITCMMSRQIQTLGTGNSKCTKNENRNSSEAVLARQVTTRIHLSPAPIDEFDLFLITLRNPFDRIVSWYFYLHPDYPPLKAAHHKKGCQSFAFYRCWPTLQEFVSVGLATNRTTSTHLHHSNQTAQECAAWAWDAATGLRHCWHNYWNFNRTYAPLLSAYNNEQARSNYSHSNSTSTRNKVIFGIRTEHVWDDWRKIDAMLGGTGELVEPATKKNNFSAAMMIKRPNKDINAAGRNHLCAALCQEIQIYKKLLHLSKNLCAEDRAQSIAELIRTCPNESENVRECSTDF